METKVTRLKVGRKKIKTSRKKIKTVLFLVSSNEYESLIQEAIDSKITVAGVLRKRLWLPASKFRPNFKQLESKLESIQKKDILEKDERDILATTYLSEVEYQDLEQRSYTWELTISDTIRRMCGFPVGHSKNNYTFMTTYFSIWISKEELTSLVKIAFELKLTLSNTIRKLLSFPTIGQEIDTKRNRTLSSMLSKLEEHTPLVENERSLSVAFALIDGEYMELKMKSKSMHTNITELVREKLGFKIKPR